jgi:hypothetical protein
VKHTEKIIVGLFAIVVVLVLANTFLFGKDISLKGNYDSALSENLNSPRNVDTRGYSCGERPSPKCYSTCVIGNWVCINGNWVNQPSSTILQCPYTGCSGRDIVLTYCDNNRAKTLILDTCTGAEWCLEVRDRDAVCRF